MFIRCVKRQSVADLCKSPLSETKLRCHDDEFKCLNTHKCIPRQLVRDDKDQCTLDNEFTCLVSFVVKKKFEDLKVV